MALICTRKQQTEGFQPRTQACSRYPSDQRRLGTERDSVLGEFSRQAWQVTSHQKSPRTTGNEAGRILVVVVKVRHRAIVLLLKAAKGLLQLRLFSSPFKQCYFRGLLTRWRIDKKGKETSYPWVGGAGEPFHHPPTRVVHPPASYLRIIIRPSQCPGPLKLCCRPRKSHRKKKQGSVKGLMVTEHELTVKLASE